MVLTRSSSRANSVANTPRPMSPNMMTRSQPITLGYPRRSERLVRQKLYSKTRNGKCYNKNMVDDFNIFSRDEWRAVIALAMLKY